MATEKALARRAVAATRKHPLLASLAAVSLPVCLAGALLGDRQLVVNTSGSVPPGLYLRTGGDPFVGAFVDLVVPSGGAATYVRSRTGLDPSRCYLLKPVAAGPGDVVDAGDDRVTVNGRRLGPSAPSRDAAGRPLPAWRGHRVLGPDEWFLYSDRIPNGFDGRCFGPVRRTALAAVRRPLITWR